MNDSQYYVCDHMQVANRRLSYLALGLWYKSTTFAMWYIFEQRADLK